MTDAEPKTKVQKVFMLTKDFLTAFQKIIVCGNCLCCDSISEFYNSLYIVQNAYVIIHVVPFVKQAIT